MAAQPSLISLLIMKLMLCLKKLGKIYIFLNFAPTDTAITEKHQKRPFCIFAYSLWKNTTYFPKNFKKKKKKKKNTALLEF